MDPDRRPTRDVGAPNAPAQRRFATMIRRLARRLLTLAVLALALGACSEGPLPDPPPMPRPEPTPTTGPEGSPSGKSARPETVLKWVLQLESRDRAEWREAQIRLAYLGPSVLEGLDRAAQGASPEKGERIKGVLEIMLRKSASWVEIGRWRHLAALAQPDVESGFQAAVPPETRPVLDIDGEGLEQFRRLGGFAVPAAERLCSYPRLSSAARAYGITILVSVGATHARPVVSRLTTEGSVGGVATEALTLGGLRPESDAVEFERYLGVDLDLIRGIRDVLKAREARTFDDWWEEARPVWRKWWELTPADKDRPPDREVWLNYINAFSGFRLDRAKDARGKGILRVVGPADARCQVLRDGEIVAQGNLPLSLRGASKSGTAKVVVTFADGTTWRKEVVFTRRDALTATMLPRTP